MKIVRNIFIVTLMVFGSFFGGVAVSQNLVMGTPQKNPVTESVKPTTPVMPQTPGSWGPETIADIVDQVGPAVVNVDIVKNVRITSPFRDFGNDFFGFQFAPEFKDLTKDRVVPQKGAGSGFVIDKNGYILTNEHVSDNADEIKVTLKDGRKFSGKVVGSDASLDLSIIKVEAKDLPVVKMGDSAKIRPGEWVVAIGNPYGFANSVTAGIISATGRTLEDLGKKDLIQTDAPINPGNSGGPLLNLQGEVIGINTAIVAGAQSIGFAIPINEVKAVIDELIKKGKVVRPWLGVYLKDADEKTAAFLELPIAEGVVITEVAKDSPAENMGLKKYDVIREINGSKISKSSEVQGVVQKTKVGDAITVKVYREGKTLVLNGKLKEKP
jgi:Do/DeqQ family serine protease